MKKLLILIVSAVSILMGCNSCTPCSASIQNEWEKNRVYEAKNMYITAGKVEYDGHTWYTFWSGHGSIAIAHDPNCKCNTK